MPKAKPTPRIRNRIIALENLPASELLAHPENWRLHPSKQRTALTDAISEIGFATAVICYRHDDGSLGIIDGHLRADVAGDEKIPVLITDLNEQEARTLLATADPIAALALPDKEALAKLISSLTQLPASLTNLGAGRDTPNHQAATPPLVDRSRIISQPGDLWELGHHRLICGDATDPKTFKTLLGQRRARLTFTDPPYGIDYDPDQHTARGGKIAGDTATRDDLTAILIPALKNAVRYSHPDAAYYIWHASRTSRDFADAITKAGLLELAQIIWIKPLFTMGRSHYRWQHEPCIYASQPGQTPLFTGARDQSTVWRAATLDPDGHATTSLGAGIILSDGNGNEITILPKPPSKKLRHQRLTAAGATIETDTGTNTIWEIINRDPDRIHPTQKPVALALRAIANSSLPGELILDPFAGSGSTLLACEQAGRAAACIELDPAYIDATVRRWQSITGHIGRLNGSELDLTAPGATRPRVKATTATRKPPTRTPKASTPRKPR